MSKTWALLRIPVLVPIVLGPLPAAAIPLVSSSSVIAPDEGTAVEEVRARGGRGHAAVGRHPGYHPRPPIHRPGGGWAHRPGYRPGYRPPAYRPPVYGGWRRPASYWWRPGAAVAAGAALGFVGAAAAASWAGAAPGANYCWYYTDPSRTQGFWDVCP